MVEKTGMNYDIYIAGAMTGRKVKDVLEERDIAKKLLTEYGLTWYDPAADEGLEKLKSDTVISNAFDKPKMKEYVSKDLAAVAKCKAILNLTGDLQSDGCAWEMAFATFHRFIPVIIVAPKRISGEKMSFTNILVDGMYGTLQEAVFALNEKLKEKV